MRPLSFVALAVSFIALGVALLPRDAPISVSPAPPEGKASMDGERLDRLERRIDALEESTADLWARVSRPPAAGSAPLLDGGTSPALEAEVARLRNEVRGLIAGEVLGSEHGQAALKDAVRTVQLDLESERQAAWTARRAERQAEQTKERSEHWKKFAADAKLSWAQEQTLTGRLAAEEARRGELEKAREAGGFNREARQAVSAARKETDAVMKQTLSPEQMLQFEQARLDERRADLPRPSGRGDRGGDDPGRGPRGAGGQGAGTPGAGGR